MADNQLAIGIFSIKDVHGVDPEFEFRQILLNKALLEFTKKKQVTFMIKKNTLNMEVVTSKKDLKLITNDFKTCTLSPFLTNTLPFKIGIGWGVGHSIHEAYSNAMQANQEANRNKEDSTTYLMTENDHLIGPLGDEQCIEISNEANPQIENISQQIRISTLQIQKLLAVMEKLNTNELMSDDIAQHLGITIRAANRILNNLEEKGVAEVIVRKQKKLKGRPKKLYKIDFQKHLTSTRS
ncbi:hypothetical protein [Bacillus sp. V2I10]|uniref:hypothetical protein n=1 Tax=Bacillus sp. V2I10 TaxID=3042276 RepID=UPI0027838F41|nr:hypothetical protein [Bacillus sp. V2I10]MDQ0862055.1 putative transcriptional regulator [Bacillus sp. V2I10]